MSLFGHPLRVKRIPVLGLYRATYRNCASYGRTPAEATRRVHARYKNTRLTPTTILGQLAVILWPF